MEQASKTRIGRRISQLVAVAVFLAVFGAASLQTVLQAKREIQNRHTYIEGTALAISATAGDAVANDDKTKALLSLKAIARIPELLTASIIRHDGTKLASLGQATVLESDVHAASENDLAMLFNGRLPVLVEIINGGEVHGHLFILGDISGLRLQVISNFLLTFASALIAALLAMLASRPLQNRIIKPLVDLTISIKKIQDTRNYAVSLDRGHSTDEVGILVKSFNGLMTDIRTRDGALQRLAYHDPMTGLANRVSFQRTLDDWLEDTTRPQRGAVVLLNIHGFRSLNDAFSHSIGDAVLMTVAAQISDTIEDSNSLARYSADEFVLLLREQHSQAEVETAIARIQAAFFKPLPIGDLELHVSLTAGAVILSNTECRDIKADAALRYVDLALVEARRLATGRVQFFEQRLADVLHNEIDFGQALRQAAKLGSFEIHFQSQLDLQTNTISGFEALARWTDPQRGPISPAIFIPLAERIGLISVIGDWILQEACKQAATWLKKGYPRRTISVNVSPAQLLAAGFVEKVRAALKISGLPPELLCLELTESMFVGANYAETIILLETLAKDGIRLSLDDFGTGYSSLGYLSKLPFHTIKIDRSFVTLADKSERKRKMLKSIVEMVHALGMQVVAEGAERNEEINLLSELSVEKVQGYLISKPLPNDEALRNAAIYVQSFAKAIA